MVEIIALYHGLDLRWLAGQRHIVCYAYFLHVIQLVIDPLNVFHTFDNFTKHSLHL